MEAAAHSGRKPRITAGVAMILTVSDFAPPRTPDWSEEDAKILRFPVRKMEPETQEDIFNTPKPVPRRPLLREDEYPEWLDDVPPWRNPDPKGNPYLFVWEQHAARMRGHH